MLTFLLGLVVGIAICPWLFVNLMACAKHVRRWLDMRRQLCDDAGNPVTGQSPEPERETMIITRHRCDGTLVCGWATPPRVAVLLLLLSSPAHAWDGMWPTVGMVRAHAQTAAQEMGPVTVLDLPPDRTCQERLQECRDLALELHREKAPARWPWALGCLALGMLLGVYGLLRSGLSVASHRVMMQRFNGEWEVSDPRTTKGWPWLWQAFRDAWRLSRKAGPLLLALALIDPVWAQVGMDVPDTEDSTTAPKEPPKKPAPKPTPPPKPTPKPKLTASTPRDRDKDLRPTKMCKPGQRLIGGKCVTTCWREVARG